MKINLMLPEMFGVLATLAWMHQRNDWSTLLYGAQLATRYGLNTEPKKPDRKE